MATNGKLNSNQRRAIAALLTSPNVRAAAAQAHVGERTLHRWLKESAEFREAFRQAQDGAIALATARLAGQLPAAVETLAGIADDTNAKASARVSAARALLAEARQLREFGDLAARLDELEARLANG